MAVLPVVCLQTGSLLTVLPRQTSIGMQASRQSCWLWHCWQADRTSNNYSLKFRGSELAWEIDKFPFFQGVTLHFKGSLQMPWISALYEDENPNFSRPVMLVTRSDWHFTAQHSCWNIIRHFDLPIPQLKSFRCVCTTNTKRCVLVVVQKTILVVSTSTGISWLSYWLVCFTGTKGAADCII